MDQKKYLKKLHEVQIEILDEIDNVCKKNNIKYFLVGGTLLGAIRHNGFIPWDDDVDIGMFRDDYEKFKKICLDNNALSSKYFLHCLETDKNYYIPFIKVRKNNTSFNEKTLRNLDTHKGIFVDIFPYDRINSDRGFFNKLRAFITLNIVDAIYCKQKIKKINNCRKKIFVRCLMLFSSKKLFKIQDKILTTKNKKNNKYLGCFIGGANPFAEFFEKSNIDSLINVSFEGKEYPTIKDYDKYLTRLYGDYMKLPPKDKRITHQPEFISFTEGKNIKTKRIEK